MFVTFTRVRRLVCAALLVVACGGALRAQSQPFRPDHVKAVFLFNFTQFVQWPAAAFPDPATPLTIGVLGSDPFGSILDEAVRGETADGRPLAISRFRRLEDVGSCHILFISRSEGPRYDDILHALGGRPILTVGEDEAFTAEGGMIRLVTEQNRVRVRVNLSPVKAAGLTISSQLLRVADVIGGGGNH
jgi:hypothetical protein